MNWHFFIPFSQNVGKSWAYSLPFLAYIRHLEMPLCTIPEFSVKGEIVFPRYEAVKLCFRFPFDWSCYCQFRVGYWLWGFLVPYFFKIHDSIHINLDWYKNQFKLTFAKIYFYLKFCRLSSNEPTLPLPREKFTILNQTQAKVPTVFKNGFAYSHG